MKSNAPASVAEPAALEELEEKKTCRGCGMSQEAWQAPTGYTEGDKTYCCKGCAAGEVCACR